MAQGAHPLERAPGGEGGPGGQGGEGGRGRQEVPGAAVMIAAEEDEQLQAAEDVLSYQRFFPCVFLISTKFSATKDDSTSVEINCT